MKIRIQARETVRYEKTVVVNKKDLADVLIIIRGGLVTPMDLWLDPSDIQDGEVDADDIEIDVEENGKWKPVDFT
jgi:hypothetical protein